MDFPNSFLFPRYLRVSTRVFISFLILGVSTYIPKHSVSMATMERDTGGMSPPAAKKPLLDMMDYAPFMAASPLISQTEVNELADQLKDWLHRNPNISQVRFAKHVLQRAQGTLSQLLKLRTAPTSKMGEKVWIKIKDFMNDSHQQDVLLNECGGPSRLKGSSTILALIFLFRICTEIVTI